MAFWRATLRHSEKNLLWSVFRSRNIGQNLSGWARCGQLAPISSDYPLFNRIYSVTGCSLPIQNSPWLQYFSSSSPEDSIEPWDISTLDLARLVSNAGTEEGNGVRLVDVREPEELIESGQIPGAINIPLGDVEDALGLDSDLFEQRYGVSKPSPDTNIIFTCRAGIRSLDAIEMASKLGYSKVQHYSKGFLGWQDYLDEQDSEVNEI